VKPVALDLFCCEGGAAAGYAAAGFSVIGVDSDGKALRRYPYSWYHGDWRHGLIYWLDQRDVALIHASPPCQLYTAAQFSLKNKPAHPDLIGPVRDALTETGKPYVIENVPGAPLRDPVELCGCMFDMQIEYRGQRFALYRPRLFEASFPITQPEHKPHEYPAMPVFGHSMPGNFIRKWGWNVPSRVRSQLMGTEWMTRDACSQSIPPLFSEYVGRQFLAAHHGQVITDA
jgi:DNA (cytosine-5)-methyltransferase 1